MNKVLFAGSFDPITKAHLDIIQRLSRLNYEVVVGILNNSAKKYYFNAEDRVEMIQLAINEIPNTSVILSNDLLVNVCKQNDIEIVARGLRNIKDYEYEKEMEFNNLKLHDTLEYIYINTKQEYIHISSSIVRELLKYNQSINHLVSKEVNDYILKLNI